MSLDDDAVQPAAPLRVGVVLSAAVTASGDSASPQRRTRTRLDALCEALSAELQVEAEGYGAFDYPDLLEAMTQGDVDVAWLPPVVALRAASSGRALPIVLPVRRGVSSFYTALFARRGSRFTRASELEGVHAAWVDPQSASGYLVIRAALRAQAVDFESAFFEETFYGSHADVVRAVLDGEAQVGATFMHRSAQGIWRAGWGDADVQIVSRVGPIPSDVIAAAVHLPVPRIREVQRALLDGEGPVAQAAATLVESEGFVEAQSEHLKPLEELLHFLEDTAIRWMSTFPPASQR